MCVAAVWFFLMNKLIFRCFFHKDSNLWNLLIKIYLNFILTFRSHHFIWALMFAQFNTVVNPLLYGVLSENFRACFFKLWMKRDLAAHNPTTNATCNANGTGSGERASCGCYRGGTSTAAGVNSGKTLKVMQDRLSVKTSAGCASSCSSSMRPSKISNCSIASIVEVPGSEKL